MNLSDFDYFLPEHLIAQSPLEKRDHSKLLICERKTQTFSETHFFDIASLLGKNDVLVLNKTQVIPARLYGEIDIFPNWKKEVKKVEILLHREISSHIWECLWYPWKNLKVWRTIRFYDENWKNILEWYIEKISEMGRFIRFNQGWYELLKTLEILWEVPLPHYITKKLDDIHRYQTVFSEIPGSAAAPTAWLHFTKELLEKIQKSWTIIEYVLLHVWVWTFKPVETNDITQHQMHYEYIQIEKQVAQRLNQYKQQWKRIIAVGTTSVRTLESFCEENGKLQSGEKETNIFIYPGYSWKFVDSIITNFHLPMSTLLMLISAFSNRDFIMSAYEYAIKNEFRFFSFWDAMWIT